MKDLPGGSPIPDVEVLMQRIRSGLADKIDRGGYSPADLAAARGVEYQIRQCNDPGPAPAEDIARLHASCDPLGPHSFTSHRAGVGRLIVGGKRWLRRLSTPVAAVVLASQREFNGAAARLLTGVSRGLQSLETDSAALQRRIDELERRDLELGARCDALQGEVRSLQARLGPPGAK